MSRRLHPGERRPCEACGKQIVGALTRKGVVAPIELEPDPRGNVLLFRKSAPGYPDATQCRTFAGFALDELVSQGVPLRLNHFAYCPERERFKRRSGGDEQALEGDGAARDEHDGQEAEHHEQDVEPGHASVIGDDAGDLSSSGPA
jgi:hypothetical protein